MRKHLTSLHKKFANPEIKAKIYKCEKRHKEFGYKKGLQYHVEKVCGIKPKDKICEICDKSFHSKFQLSPSFSKTQNSTRPWKICQIQ